MRTRAFAASSPGKIEQQMTPLIDIVFQLLAFFILTFQVARVEGDFSLRMPGAIPGGDIGCGMPPLRIRLRADSRGKLASVHLGEFQLRDIDELHQRIVAIVGTNTGPGSLSESAEVELQCDHNLHYRHTIAAVAAVTGHIGPSRRIVKLIEKIRFAPLQAAGDYRQ